MAKKNKNLTAEEERELCRRIATGDKEARDELIMRNLALATWFANKYRTFGVDLDDLVGEARIGLIEAVDRYDASRGRFAHYAGFLIRRRLRQAIAEQGATIARTPISAFALLVHFRQAEHELLSETGITPDDETLADYLDWPLNDVRTARLAATSRGMPLKASAAARNVSDGQPEPGADLERTDALEAVLGLLGGLQPRERWVLSEWLRGRTMENIAKQCHWPFQKLREARDSAIEHLRELAEEQLC